MPSVNTNRSNKKPRSGRSTEPSKTAAPQKAPSEAAPEERRALDRVLSFLVYATFFLCLIYPYRDFDWGYHYRYGEYLLNHGELLRKDIFSWSMDGYKWVNHAWLYDPLVYLIYRWFSFAGLSVVGAIVCFLSFYLGVKKWALSYWQIGLLAIFFQNATSPVINQGIRSQVVALLLYSALLYCLFQERDGKKWSYWAFPFIFLIWANLHGSFPLGLAIFAVFLTCDFLLLFRSKVISVPCRWLLLAASFMASVAATFINPFTYHVYVEAFRHFGDPLLVYVTEWDYLRVGSWGGRFFAIFSLSLLTGFIIRRRLSDLPFIVTSLILGYLAVRAMRHVSPFMIITLPFAAMMLRDAHLNFERRFRAVPVISAGIIAATLWFVSAKRIFPLQLPSYSMEAYCSYGPKCSEVLTQYLLQNPPMGRGFNYYDWGSYLVGRGIRAKIFVDGRMHLWERDGYRAFAEYWRIYNDHDMKKFSQYRFDWVIAQTNSTLSRILESANDGLGLGRWKKVFSDRRASYFVREE